MWYCGRRCVYTPGGGRGGGAGAVRAMGKVVCQHKMGTWNTAYWHNEWRVVRQVGETQRRVATQGYGVLAQIERHKPLCHNGSWSLRTCLESRLLWNQQQDTKKPSESGLATNRSHHYSSPRLLLPSIHQKAFAHQDHYFNTTFHLTRGISVSATNTPETSIDKQHLVSEHANRSPEAAGLMANGTEVAFQETRAWNRICEKREKPCRLMNTPTDSR